MIYFIIWFIGYILLFFIIRKTQKLNNYNSWGAFIFRCIYSLLSFFGFPAPLAELVNKYIKIKDIKIPSPPKWL